MKGVSNELKKYSGKVDRQILQIMLEDEANKQRDIGNDEYRQGFSDGWERATEYYEAMLETYFGVIDAGKDL